MSLDRVRAVVNWINLTTPLGLLLARLGRAELRRGPMWLWVADRYRGPAPKAGAFMVGSVVLVPDGRWDDLTQRNPGLLEHEKTHAEQWAWLGLFFLPGYLAAIAWSRLRTGTNHGANLFEVRADLLKGGYPINGR
ncbi:MAG: hypothetical protein WBL05_12185 [Brooklawnia sp.]|uniref:hypothetical protein n=1 Tax=Brooklawnia sp. TaxID=2699740 RepID=UPI003C71ABE0